ncbi:hypothetical protein HY947_02420 [Candidatus Gottesmanbacteria bacterium]|nr:hypothetical protein [Candidatus Gottesmanbacteria bacterium]
MTTDGTKRICALEQGSTNYIREVEKILEQRKNGVLLQRMELGLNVPTNGAEYVAHMIAQKLGLKRKNQPATETQEITYKKPLVDHLLTNGYREALARKQELTQTLLALCGFTSTDDFVRAVEKDTAVIMFAAGKGKRWDESLRKITISQIDQKKPRILAQIQNILPNSKSSQSTVPIGQYAAWATRGLGQHIVVHHGYAEEIKRSITDPLGIQNAVFFEQQYDANGNALGHGDALLQMQSLIQEKKYVITQGGTDPNSRETAILSLLTLYAYDKLGTPLSLVLPSASMQNPPYPITVNNNGLPTEFGHPKLKGSGTIESGVTNIGIRVYRSEDLLKLFNTFKKYNRHYESVPGHAKETNELSLDDFDTELLREILGHGVRQLAVAIPEEIQGTVKRYDDIPAFLDSMRKILNIEEN